MNRRGQKKAEDRSPLAFRIRASSDCAEPLARASKSSATPVMVSIACWCHKGCSLIVERGYSRLEGGLPLTLFEFALWTGLEDVGCGPEESPPCNTSQDLGVLFRSN